MTYRGPGSGGVWNAAPGCQRDGCQLRATGAMVEAARQMIEEIGRSKMSQALWCDAGGHAFSERDPGRQRISVTVLDEETDSEKMETRDFCGACAEQAGLLSKRRTRPVEANAITSAPRPDPARIRDLETDLGMPHAPLG